MSATEIAAVVVLSCFLGWVAVLIAILVGESIADAIRERRTRRDEILAGLREPTWKQEPTPTRKEARG